MNSIVFKTQFPVLFVLCLAQSALAGVRHSRSINGTGQPIPKNQYNQPTATDPNYSQGIPVPNQYQPAQTSEQTGVGQSAPPMQAPPPMIVPPPMPVQIPAQTSGTENIQPQSNVTPAQRPPVQVAPQTPVAPPVPVVGNQQAPQQAGQSTPVPAPVVVPPPTQLQVPKQTNDQVAPQTQPPAFEAQLPPLPPQAQPEGLPNTPVHPPERSQFAPPSQNFVPNSADVPSGDTILPGGQSIIPHQGQPNLAPAPAGRMSGGRYLTSTYGMAGCGLGSMVFRENTRSQQWLASIINDAIIPQSLPITTGTSNCFDIDEEQSQAEQEIFIDTNFHTLKTDVVRGDGETLRAYADLVGCYKDNLYDTFASLSQGQYGFIFSDSLPQSVAERFRDSLKRSRALKTRCDRLF